MTVCLYHGNCLDGTAAAWVVMNYAEEEIKCIPVKYGEEPDLLLIKDKTVYIVDFSYPVEIMEQLELHSKRLVVLDHHASAERALAEFKPKKPTTEIIFDMTQSGAGLAWHYFNPEVEAPLHIQYVQDRYTVEREVKVINFNDSSIKVNDRCWIKSERGALRAIGVVKGIKDFSLILKIEHMGAATHISKARLFPIISDKIGE